MVADFLLRLLVICGLPFLVFDTWGVFRRRAEVSQAVELGAVAPTFVFAVILDWCLCGTWTCLTFPFFCCTGFA